MGWLPLLFWAPSFPIGVAKHAPPHPAAAREGWYIPNAPNKVPNPLTRVNKLLPPPNSTTGTRQGPS